IHSSGVSNLTALRVGFHIDKNKALQNTTQLLKTNAVYKYKSKHLQYKPSLPRLKPFDPSQPELNIMQESYTRFL
ncbi:MAG TPA: hypothetical protein VKX35_00080, partial [Fermentimonas sp.]|nr:hypothetical protein [Fermentimonas sp.]